MGLLNSALQIGRSAILGYQSALQVVGSNISSAGSPDYTRLTPGLDPLQGPQTGRELQPGAGVALTSIQRNIDEALEGRVRLAIGTEASAVVQRQSLARLESLFSSFDGTDLGTRIGNLLRTFDLFVMSSREEGLGTSILDAMSCELPVVATAAGGIPDVVTNETTGLLVPTETPGALAAAIVRLAEDPPLASRLATQARRRVLDRFTATRMAEGNLRVYETLLNS